jgi:transposase
MTHRIRLAMLEDQDLCEKLAGVCEVDETYTRGKRSGPRGRRSASKIPVIGTKERRSSKVPMQAVSNVLTSTLQDFIHQHSAAGSEMHADEFTSYLWFDSSELAHRLVNHTEKFVDDDAPVNGVPNGGAC